MEELPQVIEKPFHSKFEHNYFKGYDLEGDADLGISSFIGMQIDELQHFLKEMERSLLNYQSYYYGPELDLKSFAISGDIVLSKRRNRRGPFIIKVNNDIVPGKFIIEASSHLFKISSRIQKALKEEVENFSHFTLGNIDDIFALSFNTKIEDYSQEAFKVRLLELISVADEIEDRLMNKDDMNVFG
jgi:hypothetical protein